MREREVVAMDGVGGIGAGSGWVGDGCDPARDGGAGAGWEDRAAADLLSRYGRMAARLRSPVWLEVAQTGDGSLDCRVVERREGLLGRRLGRRWTAAAVVATGRFRQLEPARPVTEALAAGLDGGLTFAGVVSRRGHTGWSLLLPDGRHFDEKPEEGMTLDTLRRAVGLATPPPPSGPAPLQLLMWVAAIHRAAGTPAGRCGCGGDGRGGRRRLSWGEALGLHPALIGTSPADPAGAESVIRAVATATNWESVRTLAAAGLGQDVMPSPALAGWMDEGMFARWVLATLPDLDETLAFVGGDLTVGAGRRLAAMFSELWG
jgi:hypothetical protein